MTRLTGAKPTILLQDYQPPAWRIDRLELALDLDPADTVVAARLVLERTDPGSNAPLVLDAAGQSLLALRIDGDDAALGSVQATPEAIRIEGLADRAVVETRVRIAPARNTALQGLYLSGTHEAGFLLTQCEAEGFRHITPFIDRPDVLARYDVTLRADRTRFPLLLANGNQVAAGDLPDGRHWARFVDPHPKPSYLFALVAGRLETLEDHFTTAEGRRVRLAIHAEADVIGRCAWAMACLKLAMRWDEERFGRCYDLDVFHIVATHDFTMGAMENKGLNIFNAKYLLADPQHATDDDYRHVLAVVGHEYFHNWSGNRVTCRDWFQLCLKEGLTVYREQEFESDLASRTLRRIEDVATLWRAQFSEDAGPLAHPVRPDRYSEINNFYTATVYEKGAEIVRMLATVLGREGFRRGLDRYFERNDGRAATVEDFLAALGEANDRDLSPWLAWYAQAGTPELSVHARHDPLQHCHELTLSQRTAPTPGQPHKQPLPIPVVVSLFDADGHALPLRLEGADDAPGERVLLLEGESARFRFTGIDAPAFASVLRGCSAPVRLLREDSAAALALQARHDDDGFNRWFAVDALARRLFAQALEEGSADAATLQALVGSLAAALDDPALDPALVAALLAMPDSTSLTDQLQDLDAEAVHAARRGLEVALARALEQSLLTRYHALAAGAGASADLAAQSRRRLRNACLAALCRVDARHLDLARTQLATAANLTDALAALSALANECADDADDLLEQFARERAADPLVFGKWLAVQAAVPAAATVERVDALAARAEFRWTSPNDAYALIGTFASRNPRAFHRADGAGYRLLGKAVARLDAITPQVAARLATAFGSWHRQEPARRQLMRAELERLAALANPSPDLSDIVRRSLAA